MKKTIDTSPVIAVAVLIIIGVIIGVFTWWQMRHPIVPADDQSQKIDLVAFNKDWKSDWERRRLEQERGVEKYNLRGEYFEIGGLDAYDDGTAGIWYYDFTQAEAKQMVRYADLHDSGQNVVSALSTGMAKSPDGRYFSFFIDTSDSRTALWLYDTEEDKVLKIRSSDVPGTAKRRILLGNLWMADSQHLISTWHKEGESDSLFITDVINGEITELLADFSQNITYPRFLDRNTLYFLVVEGSLKDFVGPQEFQTIGIYDLQSGEVSTYMSKYKASFFWLKKLTDKKLLLLRGDLGRYFEQENDKFVSNAEMIDRSAGQVTPVFIPEEIKNLTTTEDQHVLVDLGVDNCWDDYFFFRLFDESIYTSKTEEGEGSVLKTWLFNIPTGKLVELQTGDMRYYRDLVCGARHKNIYWWNDLVGEPYGINVYDLKSEKLEFIEPLTTALQKLEVDEGDCNGSAIIFPTIPEMNSFLFAVNAASLDLTDECGDKAGIYYFDQEGGAVYPVANKEMSENYGAIGNIIRFDYR